MIKKNSKQVVLVIILAISFLSSVAYSFSSSDAESIVAQHNTKAHEIYNQLKNKYIQKTDPLIIAWGDRLAFYHNHVLQEYPIVSGEYRDLKGISHVTLAVFALLNPLNQFPKNIADVEAYKSVIDSTEKAVDSLPLSAEQKIRQKQILGRTNQVLQKAISKKEISDQSVADFFNSISPFIMKNINEASRNEINLLNKQMAKIQHQLTPEERSRLFVVIPVSKMPRQDNLVGQYFSKYLNAPIDSARLTYAEGLTDTENVLSVVGTWQIEAALSAAFFHDPNKMKKDILGVSTQEYLQTCKVDKTGRSALICDGFVE